MNRAISTPCLYIQLLRLDRPVGIVFLLLPCLWGLTVSCTLTITNIFLYTAGAILMRSAGCVYNDLVDRNIDAQVERTRQRPLACGTITPRNAIITMLVLLSLAAIVLWQFDWPTIGLGLLSLLLVSTYPWLKRITYWPQLCLGLAFNWGVLMAGGINRQPLLLFLYGILWTIFYDTLYAHQDKTDDAIIGVKSTALRLGEKTKPFLSVLTFVQMLIVPYAALIAAWILYKVDLDDPASCLWGFKRSQVIGWVVFINLIIGGQ